MHICLVCREYLPSRRGGGIATYQRELAYGLVKKGHKVTVICASDDTRFPDKNTLYSKSDDNGVTVLRLYGADFFIPSVEPGTKLNYLRGYWRYFSYRKRIRTVIESFDDIDIIEVPEYGSESRYLHNLNIPVIIRLHTPILLDHYTFGKKGLTLANARNFWYQKQELVEIEKAKYITSCSTSLSQWAQKYLHITAHSLNIIYNPISAYIDPKPIRKTLANEIHILFAGTICDWKGCGELAEAGIILSQRLDKNFKIHFVGKTGSFATQLKSKYGNEEWFVLEGMKPRNELLEMYSEMDVVCFPSWWENMPMVCIEAMSKGAIVAGSNSGGMSEIITDGVDGFLFEPRNPLNIVTVIERALSMTEENREEMTKAAQEKILKNFTSDVIVEQTINNYISIKNHFKSNYVLK